MQPVDRTDEDRSFIEDARRRQIVTAAIAAIAEEGYSRASFVRIAARASISPGLITYHFKTKENLIREVLGHIDARLDRAMEGGPEPLEGFEDGLRRIVTGHVTYCASHPQEMVARREVLSAALPPALQEHVARGNEAGRAELVGFLAEGQRHGEFRPFDPEVFTDALFAALGSAPRSVALRPTEEHAAYAREMADLFAEAATGRG
ncbi:TetR/AcrR family transcriptional regulator [Nocardiopsis sp. NPDC101807]|uniref:TetR/AcrR family transcriptional regulator n=1 Tax=Nocardiopsis sp. NPDC101807 TaxID=3364339 RepID=UPI003802BB06